MGKSVNQIVSVKPHAQVKYYKRFVKNVNKKQDRYNDEKFQARDTNFTNYKKKEINRAILSNPYALHHTIPCMRKMSVNFQNEQYNVLT